MALDICASSCTNGTEGAAVSEYASHGEAIIFYHSSENLETVTLVPSILNSRASETMVNGNEVHSKGSHNRSASAASFDHRLLGPIKYLGISQQSHRDYNKSAVVGGFMWECWMTCLFSTVLQ